MTGRTTVLGKVKGRIGGRMRSLSERGALSCRSERTEVRGRTSREVRNAEPEGHEERMKMGPVRTATREAARNGSRARAMRAQTVAKGGL